MICTNKAVSLGVGSAGAKGKPVVLAQSSCRFAKEMLTIGRPWVDLCATYTGASVNSADKRLFDDIMLRCAVRAFLQSEPFENHLEIGVQPD